MFSYVKQELSVLIWLLKSKRSGKDVLQAATDIVFDLVSMCFVVLDREYVKKMTKSEMISLMFDLATGKIYADNERKFSTYLLNRYLRLTQTLLKLKAITLNDVIINFSSINNRKTEDNFSDIFVYVNGIDTTDLQQSDENCAKDKKDQVKEKTVQKELKILRIKEFFPGCLGQKHKIVQKPLF